MSKIFSQVGRCALILMVSAFLASLGGCAAAVVGGAAGAGGTIAYTDRGAKGDVKGTVDEVNARAEQVLKGMKIELTGSSTAESGKEKNISGKSGEAEVSVEIKALGQDSAHVEVVVREELLKWNKDRAKEILAKIVEKG